MYFQNTNLEESIIDKELKKQKENLESDIRKQANQNKERLDERNKISRQIQKLENDFI